MKLKTLITSQTEGGFATNDIENNIGTFVINPIELGVNHLVCSDVFGGLCPTNYNMPIGYSDNCDVKGYVIAQKIDDSTISIRTMDMDLNPKEACFYGLYLTIE